MPEHNQTYPRALAVELDPGRPWTKREQESVTERFREMLEEIKQLRGDGLYRLVERHTIEMLNFAFQNVAPGEALTKQQRAWLDKLFQEASRGVG